MGAQQCGADGTFGVCICGPGGDVVGGDATPDAPFGADTIAPDVVGADVVGTDTVGMDVVAADVQGVDVVTPPLDVVTPPLDVVGDSGMVCTGGAMRACYTGPVGTDGRGVCRGGTQTCSGGVWPVACTGERVPSAEVCGNSLDDNCNGTVDDGCPPPGLPHLAVGGLAFFACAVLPDGTMRCAGRNNDGQLGSGVTGIDQPTPGAVLGVANAADAALGDHHACARIRDGSVRCWGGNVSGELGNGTNIGSPIAVTPAVTNVSSLCLGQAFTCALRSDNTVMCWGSTASYGLASPPSSNTPIRVASLDGARAIACAVNGVCAVMADGSVQCRGAVGPNSYSATSTPGVTLASQIAGGGNFAGAVLLDGSMRFWGFNGYGEFGNGTVGTSPAAGVPGGAATMGATRLVLGTSFSCALMSDGRVLCSGVNNYGQVGDGTTTMRTMPVVVTLPGPAAEVSAHSQHACAVLRAGGVYCWGDNNWGELGVGDRAVHAAPVRTMF